MEEVCEAVTDDFEDSFLDVELEALKSIYINEIEVKKENEKSTSVSIDLHPATADNIEQQYVRMTLKFILMEEYPEVLPDINIKNPRGLSDEKLKSVLEDLLSIAQEKKGNSMLFEIIEAAKEHLTSQNRPSGECAICLYGFSDSDIFTRTECYHYYHSHCLSRYAKNILQNSEDQDDKSEDTSSELLCPMCRIPIQFCALDEQYPPPNAHGEEPFCLNDDILELQKKMADLYQKQLEKGGIIDVEAERNKYLLEISNMPTRSSSADKSSSNALDKASNEEALKDNVSVSPQNVTKSKSSKFGPKQNFHESDYVRKKYDSKYEKGYDRYKRKNYDKYQNNKFQSSNDASSNNGGEFKEQSSTKDSSQVLSESPSKNVNDPENRNYHNSMKPKFSNYSGGRGGYYNNPSHRNPRYNQSGRYNRYDYSNNASNYSYNRDKRYSTSSSYNKSNFRDKNSSESNFYKCESPKDLDERTHLNQDSNLDEKDESSHYKSKFNNERTDRSYSHNSRESYSKKSDNVKDLNMRRYANQRRAQHIGKNIHSANGENCMQEEEDKPETSFMERNKGYSGRNRNSSNYSRHSMDSFQTNAYDYKRHNQFPKNSQSYNHYNQQSQRTRSNKEPYGSSNLKNREYRDKIQPEVEEKFPECEIKETESSLPEHLQQEEGVESTQGLKNDVSEKCSALEMAPASSATMLRPPPGFANPSNRVFYGLQAANPPPGFRRS